MVLVESNTNDEDIRRAALLCSMYCKKTATLKHINVFKKGHQKTIRLGQKEYILDKDIADWRI